MKVFLDANVVLDSIVKRDNPQFSEDANTLLALGEQRTITLYMSMLTVPLVAYVLKNITEDKKKRILQDLTSIISILPSLPEHIDGLYDSHVADIEDYLQIQSAREGQCEIIVTRDTDDFKHSDIPAVTPGYLLERIIE
jgi:predicted nucleic acid-binding protein